MRFGLFREEGLDGQIVLMNGRLVGPALLQGDLDYSTLADTMMRAATTGLPVKVLAFGGIRPALALNVRPEIETGADLNGKSIAVTSIGTTTDLVAREILRSVGLNPERDIVTRGLGSQANSRTARRAAVEKYGLKPDKDVFILQGGGQSERFAVLKAGVVDAAIVSPPLNLAGRQLGFNEVIDLSEAGVPYAQ